LSSVRQAATARLRVWAARRHGLDTLPVTIHRRRIYILPTRFGIMLASLLVAMMIAGLNYNSNLGLAFAFLMVSLGLVAMHHCHRNLLGLSVDVNVETDAFAGRDAAFDFMLRNQSSLDRCDIEILCTAQAEAIKSVGANSYEQVTLNIPVAQRGVTRWNQFELRTSYPFGWFRAWTYVQGSLTAFVAPYPQGSRPLPSAGAVSGSIATPEVRGDEDFAGLRSYSPGVPLKHMAWKVLARGGDAAVRSYTGAASQPEWLEWSALQGLDTEARLSQLCRWVLESEAGYPRSYGLRLPGVEVLPARGAIHRARCLRALAMYAAEPTH
jgi:uncharacterized protein (DUF58 family)